MSNPNVPTKVTGDTLAATEVNSIVTSIGTKQDIGSSTADGIISGLTLSVAGLNLTVAAGSWRIAGIVYSTTEDTLIVLQNADLNNNRIDLVYGDNLGDIAVVTGQVAVNPVKPNLPADAIEIGFVLVTPTGTSTTDSPPASYVTQTDLLSTFGNKENLTTDNKNTGVEAINEVKQQITALDQDNVILKIFKKSNYS